MVDCIRCGDSIEFPIRKNGYDVECESLKEEVDKDVVMAVSLINIQTDSKVRAENVILTIKDIEEGNVDEPEPVLLGRDNNAEPIIHELSSDDYTLEEKRSSGEITKDYNDSTDYVGYFVTSVPKIVQKTAIVCNECYDESSDTAIWGE